MVLGKRQFTQREFDQMRRSTCGNCPAGCGIKVYTKEGRIVDILGDEEHPVNKGSFCPKGLLAYLHTNNAQRLTQPMLRLARDASFRRVSWTEAVDFTARRLQEVETAKGRHGCYLHTMPTSPFGHRLGSTYFAREYGTPNGPWRFTPRPLGPDGAIARMFGIEGSRLITNTPRDWANSQCIVIYGLDLAATDPMTLGPVIDARERAAEVIVIDSRTTVTSTKASYALRPRPGTESIVLRGILRLLLDNQWIDEEFIHETINGVDTLRGELAHYPIELVSKDCGIPQVELERVAQVIGKSRPVQVISGGWLAAERFSDDDLRLCGALAALRGSIGIPGGGLHLLNASPFVCEEWLDTDDTAASRGALTIEGVLTDYSDSVGAFVLEGDPCARLRGGEDMRHALRQVPFIAVLGTYESATMSHADVVFPMSSWLESEGLLANGNGRSLQWHHRVVAPPGECRSHLEFWSDLSAAFGFANRLPWHDAAPGESNRVAVEWALRRNPWTRAVSVNDLDPEKNPPGGVLWPCVDPTDIVFERSRFARGDVRGIPNVLFQRNRDFPLETKRFPTKDGRLTLPPSADHTPEVPPTKVLLLIPGIAVDHVEAYSGMAVPRAGATMPVLSIHPRTAADFGLTEADIAIVYNDRGELKGVVRLTDTVAPGTAACTALPWITDKNLSLWSLRASDETGFTTVGIRRVKDNSKGPLPR